MLITSDKTVPGGWDAYVAGHADRSAYHLGAAVSVAADAFGLPVEFLSARNDQGRIVGVLPLVRQSSLVFGKYLTSLPYVNYGGILADDDAIAGALASRAAEIAAACKARHVELRQYSPVGGLGLAERLDKVTMICPLPASENELAEQLGSKLRSQIRRAEREEPEVVWGSNELLPEFYEVFAVTMHSLGTPVYSRKFFDVVADALRDLLDVIVIRKAGAVQAAAITIRHGKRVEVSWAAATHAAKRNSINMRMYWEMMQRAIREGASAFDFGRSTVDSGTYRFKAQWGAQPRQLHWYYWLPPGHAIPQINNANPKYALAVAAWQRMPLRIAKLLGPRIARNLP